MNDKETIVVGHLRSLAEAAREFCEGGYVIDSYEEETFEMEIVRTENYLLSLKEKNIPEDNELTGLQDISWKRN